MTKVDMEAWRARFEDLGSKGFARKVTVAVGNAAKHARDTMRTSMPSVLGRDVEGPGGVRGRFGAPTARTIAAIQYAPPEFSAASDVDEISVPVYVKGVQGSVGNDQRAYLKYLFGDGENIRRAGDVGMDQTRDLVPQGMPLLLTQKLGLNPYYAGGHQKRGLLSTVKARAAQSEGDMFDAGGRYRDSMRAMGASAHVRRSMHSGTPNTVAGRLNAAKQKAGIGVIHLHAKHNGFTQDSIAKAVRNYAKAVDRAPWWSVYEAPDRKSRLPTYFARPRRVRDPAGGTHPIRRANGRIGQMPNMLSVAPEYGESGPQVGPRALFYALREARYQPKLQAPWDASMAAGAEKMFEFLALEYEDAVQRKDAGRSY